MHFLIVGAIGSSVYYSSDTSQHNIIDLNCTGDESTILDCPHNNITDYSCSLSNDANIFCEGKHTRRFSKFMLSYNS